MQNRNINFFYQSEIWDKLAERKDRCLSCTKVKSATKRHSNQATWLEGHIAIPSYLLFLRVVNLSSKLT